MQHNDGIDMIRCNFYSRIALDYAGRACDMLDRHHVECAADSALAALQAGTTLIVSASGAEHSRHARLPVRPLSRLSHCTCVCRGARRPPRRGRVASPLAVTRAPVGRPRSIPASVATSHSRAQFKCVYRKHLGPKDVLESSVPPADESDPTPGPG